MIAAGDQISAPRLIGLVLGPFLFLIIVFVLPSSVFHPSALELLGGTGNPDHLVLLARSMKIVLGLLALMVTWWLTEAIPLPATALLPPVILPWMECYGVGSSGLQPFTFKSVLASFASPVIFLFLGGFLLSAAMRKWGLDRRLTFWLLARGRIASDAHYVLLGVMALTAFLSMWISNTATAALMLPVGLAIVEKTGGGGTNENFSKAMMLAIAWSASVGGVGTIIGSPPNAIAIGILDSALSQTPGYHGITFVDWMMIGVPVVLLFIPVIWRVLLFFFPPERRIIEGAGEQFQKEHRSLGSWSVGERLTGMVFLLAVVLWVSNPFWDIILPASLADTLGGVDEFLIGLFAGIILFVIPVRLRSPEGVLTWHDTRWVDWGVLILFGGGIALSDALFQTGVAGWIARSVIDMVGVQSIVVLVLVIILLVDFLTEIASNTAVTTMIVPVVISVAIATGVDPVTLSVAAALAASMAFMLPVATPPNALVYGTGKVTLREMVRTGLVLDVIGWISIFLVLWFFGSVLFGVVAF